MQLITEANSIEIAVNPLLSIFMRILSVTEAPAISIRAYKSNNPGCWIGLFSGLTGWGGEGGSGLACTSTASLCHRASFLKASSCSRCPDLALRSARPRVV